MSWVWVCLEGISMAVRDRDNIYSSDRLCKHVIKIELFKSKLDVFEGT